MIMILIIVLLCCTGVDYAKYDLTGPRISSIWHHIK